MAFLDWWVSYFRCRLVCQRCGPRCACGDATRVRLGWSARASHGWWPSGRGGPHAYRTAVSLSGLWLGITCRARNGMTWKSWVSAERPVVRVAHGEGRTVSGVDLTEPPRDELGNVVV